jgi:hypothetical protein
MRFIKTTLSGFLNEDNSHLVEVKPNRYVYHSSSPFVRDIISKEGLVPQGKSAAWLEDTKIDGKVIFAVNSDDKDDWWDSTYDDDLYKIDTAKIKNNKWFNDPNFDLEDKRVSTFEHIPIKALELIYRGSGESDVTPGWMIKNK